MKNTFLNLHSRLCSQISLKRGISIILIITSVSFGQEYLYNYNSSLSSIETLKLNVELSRLNVSKYSLLKRFLPAVRFGGNIGAHKVFLFDDQDYSLPYPYSDGWFLTCSWTLNNIFDTYSYKRARIELNKSKTAYSVELSKLKAKVRAHRLKLKLIAEQINFIEQELDGKRMIFELSEIKYKNGEMQFEEYINIKLSLLSVRKELNIIRQKKQDLEFSLNEFNKTLRRIKG